MYLFPPLLYIGRQLISGSGSHAQGACRGAQQEQGSAGQEFFNAWPDPCNTEKASARLGGAHWHSVQAQDGLKELLVKASKDSLEALYSLLLAMAGHQFKGGRGAKYRKAVGAKEAVTSSLQLSDTVRERLAVSGQKTCSGPWNKHGATDWQEVELWKLLQEPSCNIVSAFMAATPGMSHVRGRETGIER